LTVCDLWPHVNWLPMIDSTIISFHSLACANVRQGIKTTEWFPFKANFRDPIQPSKTTKNHNA
jgi:hypothetical protein